MVSEYWRHKMKIRFHARSKERLEEECFEMYVKKEFLYDSLVKIKLALGLDEDDTVNAILSVIGKMNNYMMDIKRMRENPIIN